MKIRKDKIKINIELLKKKAKLMINTQFCLILSTVKFFKQSYNYLEAIFFNSFFTACSVWFTMSFAWGLCLYSKAPAIRPINIPQIKPSFIKIPSHT